MFCLLTILISQYCVFPLSSNVFNGNLNDDQESESSFDISDYPFWDESRAIESSLLAAKMFDFAIKPNYQDNESTQSLSNYGSLINCNKYSKYTTIRNNEIDYQFHNYYNQERILLQDSIIDLFLFNFKSMKTLNLNLRLSNNKRYRYPPLQCCKSNDHELIDDHEFQDDHDESKSEKKWIIFTAGAMNVGKTFMLNVIKNEQLIPQIVNINNDDDNNYNYNCDMVHISGDLIRQLLPEWIYYVNKNRKKNRNRNRNKNENHYKDDDDDDDDSKWIPLLSNEVGLISEILLWESFKMNKNILFETSLRYTDWFENILFPKIRLKYSHYKIAIINVKPINLQSLLLNVEKINDDIKNNYNSNKAIKKRIINENLVTLSFQQSEESVEKLKIFTDVTIIITNTWDNIDGITFKINCFDTFDNKSRQHYLTKQYSWHEMIKLKNGHSNSNQNDRFSLLNICS